MGTLKTDTFLVITFTILGIIFTTTILNLFSIVMLKTGIQVSGVVREDFTPQKTTCSKACPGVMNCSEWSDCLYHQPDFCRNLLLRCKDEDETLYGLEVLAPSKDSQVWTTVLISIVLIFATGFLLVGIGRYYYAFLHVKSFDETLL